MRLTCIRQFRYAKRHFWFGDEPVDSKNLSAYIQNEKHNIAHATAAWASQTGKGLLFFGKRPEDKATPAGVINLSDVTDLAKQGAQEIVFKSNGHKHAIQAATSKEADAWYAALEAKINDAKGVKEGIISSDAYKTTLEKLGMFNFR